MKIERRLRKINYILLFVLFIFQTIDNYFREKRIDIIGLNTFKNILLLIITAVFMYEVYALVKDKKYKPIFKEETKSIIFIVITFFSLSVYYMLKNNGIKLVTFKGLLDIIIPIIVAYVILNLIGIKDIYRLMSVLLIIMFTGYLFTVSDKISFANILSIDFMASSSPFESTYFSPSAIAFTLFFCYYRENKILTFLSVLFSVMTFKRIMVIFAVFLFFFGGRFKNFKNVPQILINIFIIAFTALSFFYIWIMQGRWGWIIERLFGMNTNNFSMGRSYFMSVILNNFTSYGYMTSSINYQSMEMDIPMIYVEMGWIAVVITIFFLTRIAKNNWYNFLCIMFCLSELLTSHWFDITYFWIVAYITIGCVAYKGKYAYKIEHRIHFKI